MADLEISTEGNDMKGYSYSGRSSGRGAVSFIVALVPFLIFGFLALVSVSSGNGIMFLLFGFLAFFGAATLGSTVRINSEWEQSIVLRFGRYQRTVGSGIYFVMPFIDSVISDDMRVRTLNIPTQEVITRDNISIVVNAIVLMKIDDIKKAIINIEDYASSVAKVSTTTLRGVIGQETLDTLLTDTSQVASKIKDLIDKSVNNWGIDVIGIELQNLELPENMKRALAIQAEAQRGAKAIIIKAEAELKASETLKKAGENMKDPNAMQLRILETVSEASKESANTIIMALPLETLKSLGPGGIGALSSINSSAARRRVEERGKSRFNPTILTEKDRE
jgi:regulator of protease activity HflC (stomatin/prohibitin superfamily)